MASAALSAGVEGLLPEWRLSVIGGFALICRDHEVVLAMTEQRIVAYLVLCEGTQPRERLCAHLWLKASRSKASGNLRTALWKVNNEAPGLVETSRDALRLSTRTHTDYADATTLIERILHGPAGPPPNDFSLLTADLLPGWYDDWVINQSEHHRQRRLHALDELSLCYLRAGRHFDAVDVAQHAVEAEPLRESSQRALVAAHLAEGNRNEAMRQYERYCDLLRDEMGLAPTAQMTRLIDGCRTVDDDAALSGDWSSGRGLTSA